MNHKYCNVGCVLELLVVLYGLEVTCLNLKLMLLHCCLCEFNNLLIVQPIRRPVQMTSER